MVEKRKKRVAILTATRAEYGLLKPVIRKLSVCDAFEVNLLVTGAHLSARQGYTYKEIYDDGFDITYKVEILNEEDTPEAISESMAKAITGFSTYFSKNNPSALLVLGDRYETLAVCVCAMNHKIPIFHIHGGEITEGAIDDAIRHAITKMSLVHFASTEIYRRRVIQMGEEPQRVFNVGALGVENALNEPLMTLEELSDDLGISLSEPYVVATYHPVTLADDGEEQIEQVLCAMSDMSDYKYIITGANADCGGKLINDIIADYADHHENVVFVQSLGLRRYLSALKYCSFVMGNSSSGIIEAPSFGIPTVNIGIRQRGRIRATSVIDCDAKANSIISAMKQAQQMHGEQFSNPYGDGNTSEKIMQIIKDILLENKLDLKKKFYDLED